MRMIRQRVWFAVLLLAAMAPLPLRANNWTAPSADLARKIAAKAGPGSAMTVAVRNHSSLTAGDVADIRGQIQAQLQAHGMRIVEASQAIADVAVTLSENAEQYLWIAQIAQGSTEDLVMVGVPRASAADLRAPSALTLRRKLLLSQDEPILDVALRPGSANVLSPSKVTYYGVQGNTWQPLTSLPISHSRQFPRDVRGRLWASGENALDLSLPGVRCTQLGAQQAALNCADTDDPWPLSAPGSPIRLNAFYAPVRNFFNGTVTFQDELSKGQNATYNLPPFFSTAMVTEQGLPLWIFAGVDGRFTFFGGQRGTAGTTAEMRGWGSDLASIISPCGDERLVLASRNTDYTVPDSVQVFQVLNREAVPLTAPLDFSGPITALWNLPGDSQSVLAVSHNLKTGHYEAYALSLSCNQ